MTLVPPPLHSARTTPSPPPARMAIWLSALAFPGAGQFAQRRWVPATLYTLAFSVCLTLLTVTALTPILHNLKTALTLAEQGMAPPFEPIPMPRILFWFGLSVAIYGMGLTDTILAHGRLRRQWAEQRIAAHIASTDRNDTPHPPREGAPHGHS